MATTSLDEETAKKVIRQVEFYFSDSNLPIDKFLQKAVSETDDGMISLGLICSFGRMRTHLGCGDAKEEDIPDEKVKSVAETLRTCSSFLKVSEDGKKVGRVTPLAQLDEVIEQLDGRTISVSPLAYDVKPEEVESFFGQYAKVNSVRLPRHVTDKRLFSGSCLVEFSTEEDAERILSQSIVFAGADLELKPKKEFDVERAKQEEEAENFRSRNNKNNSKPEPDYPKGLIVAFKLKKISSEGSTGNGNVKVDSLETNKEQDTTNNVKGEEDKSEGGKAEKENLKDNMKGEENKSEGGKAEKEYPKDNVKGEETEKNNTDSETKAQESEGGEKDGAAQKDEQTPGQEKSTHAAYKDNKDVVMREDLKSIFQKFGTVKFVDFTIGSESGYIRFDDAGQTQKARAAAVLSDEGGLVVKNYIAVLDPVTGEAEREYWAQLRGGQDKRRDNFNNFKNQRGRGGGRHNNNNNRGGRHSRPRENDTGGRPNKAQKV